MRGGLIARVLVVVDLAYSQDKQVPRQLFTARVILRIAIGHVERSKNGCSPPSL